MTLSEKYFISMAVYLKTINSDIFETIMPLGVVIALFYELFEEKKLCLQDKKVIICKNRQNDTLPQKIVMDAIGKNETPIGFSEWLKEFYFSIDRDYIREILASTEKSAIKKSVLKKSEKKLLFIKKIVYTAEDDILKVISQEVADEPKGGILGYLLYRFGFLDFVCEKSVIKEVKSKIKLGLEDKSEFVGLAEEATLAISSVISASSVMM